MLTNVTRATLYLILSSLELDLRDLIICFLTPHKTTDIFGDAEIEKIGERAERDGVERTESSKLSVALQYADLGDLLQVIHRNMPHFPDSTQKRIRAVCGRIEKMLPIRNRVMHSRPLEWDDFPSVIDFAQTVVTDQTDLWKRLRETTKALKKNPELPVHTDIDFLDQARILHNLPAPDFDDTGFIGRTDLLHELRSALKGPYPVISLTGEGGFGKSALALKACYEIVDESDRFDAVVWTSAKSSRLTPNEITAIKGAITTSIGVFDEALAQIGAQANGDALRSLVNILADFRILLVIDNLETVLDKNMRSLARQMPANGSKLIFTTRVGLGELDYPIKIPAFAEKEAQHYLRRMAQVWRINDLAQLREPVLRDYVDRLQRNPLFIKWFVQAVRMGTSPASVLANPKLALEFCLQNVFEKLDDDQLKIIHAIVSTNPPHSLSILSFYTEMNYGRLELAVSHLLGSNILSQQLEKDGTAAFALSNLARLYVRSYLRPPPIEQRQYEKKERELTAVWEGYSSSVQIDRYDEHTLFIRGRADIPAAQHLKNALEKSRKKDFPGALLDVEKALAAAPDYFEVYRIGAFIHGWREDYIAAEDMYEKAIAMAPDHAPLYYFFGSFVLRQRTQAERAYHLFNEGLKKEPRSVPLKRALAHADLFLGRFEDVRNTIDGMKDEIAHLPERQRRIITGVYLQSFCREMDKEIGVENFHKALAALSGLRKAWEESRPWIDQKTVEVLGRTRARLDKLEEGLADAADRADAHNLRLWFEQTFRQPTIGGQQSTNAYAELSAHDPITGRVYSVNDKFGFLEVNGRQERLFFHKGSLAKRTDFETLRVGDQVIFRIGKNHMGPIATDMRAVEQPEYHTTD